MYAFFFQVINPTTSAVKLLGAKVEVNLRKAEPGSWQTLEQLPVQPPEKKDEDDD